MVLYHARRMRAHHGKRSETGDASAVAHAVTTACSHEIARNSAACASTVETRTRGGDSATPTRSTSGSVAASSSQRGIVESSTTGTGSGAPCATETYRRSSALTPPSARQARTTARAARQELARGG